MAFTGEQQQALKAKLRYRHVKTRAGNGTPISYVEGWHVIAEANRIFGYDSWDRQTMAPRCLWRETEQGETSCFYAAKVRVTVRAGDAIIVREGVGTGLGRSRLAETAHEIALKAAETDATKRALATFGNPFGLALYDKEQRGVTRGHRRELASIETASSQVCAIELHHNDGRSERFTDVDTFITATQDAVRGLTTVEAVYKFWEANLNSFATLPRADGENEPVRVIGSALKERVHILARNGTERGVHGQDTFATSGSEPHVGLAFPKEKRIRDKAHLAFVANEPCLVCGRRPAQAHHMRFAQRSALGLKVSDEFTVPLCNIHHDSLHQTGDERAWWARHGILDPLKIAGRLWAASRARDNGSSPEKARPSMSGPTAGQVAK